MKSFESFRTTPRQEQTPARYSASEIERQLNDYSAKYEEALHEAQTGDEGSREYLESTLKTLTDFKNSFDLTIGTLTDTHRKTYDKVKDFKTRIEEVLGTTKTTPH